MSADRDEVYESRQNRTVHQRGEPVEQNQEKGTRKIAIAAKQLVDEFMEVGFSMDAAIMLTGQVLPKLL